MNEIVTKLGKEILRAIFAAILAAIGLESVGCIACGDGAMATCVAQTESDGK